MLVSRTQITAMVPYVEHCYRYDFVSLEISTNSILSAKASPYDRMTTRLLSVRGDASRSSIALCAWFVTHNQAVTHPALCHTVFNAKTAALVPYVESCYGFAVMSLETSTSPIHSTKASPPQDNHAVSRCRSRQHAQYLPRR